MDNVAGWKKKIELFVGYLRSYLIRSSEYSDQAPEVALHFNDFKSVLSSLKAFGIATGELPRHQLIVGFRFRYSHPHPLLHLELLHPRRIQLARRVQR
jgi:hypothetical protein